MTGPATATRVLETERLRLRGFTDTDADLQLLFDLDSDPEVMRYIGPFRPSAEAVRERMQTVWLPYYTAHPTHGFWAITEKATDRFAGWVFLRSAPEYRYAAEAGWTRPTDLEIGYRFRRAAWGQGFATEAARELVRLALADSAVTGVVAAALVPNRGSWRVMEKVGMSRVREFALPPDAGFTDPMVAYTIRRDGGTLP
jgi:[ribosomal protein S5]-alanine N-acetyltransferase